MKSTLVILAAGMGSRYGGLKQIDPVGPNGESIIDYSAYDAKRAGFEKIVFVIRRDIEKIFLENVGNRIADAMAVEYVFQEPENLPEGFHVPENRLKPWGSGHAVLMARENVTEPFAVINSDDFYGKAAFSSVAAFLKDGMKSEKPRYCMMGYSLANTLSENGVVSRGICSTDSDGFLSGVVEVHDIQKADGTIVCSTEKGPRILLGNETVSMNMWGFSPSVFEYLHAYFVEFLKKGGLQQAGEFYIPSVINRLVRSGRVKVKVLRYDAQWFGMTFKEDKSMVKQNIRKLIDSGLYPSPLWE